MKRKPAITALFTLFSLGCLGRAHAETPAVEGSAAIHFDQNIIDLGEVARGERLSYSFPFRNTGTTDLKIERVHFTCACTTSNEADLVGKAIKPGESASVEILVDTELVENGDMSKVVLITSNASNLRQAGVECKAFVAARIEVLPTERLSMRAFKGVDDDQTKTLTLHAAEDVPFAIESIETTNTAIKVTVVGEKEGAVARTHELRVAIDREAAVGAQTAKLTVNTTHPQAKRVYFRVLGELRGPVVLSQSIVDFGKLSKAGAAPQVHRVRVEKRKGTDFVIKNVTSSSPAFKVTTESIKAGSIYEIVVVPSLEGVAVGGLKGTLTIVTNDPDQPELTVPLVATVAG